ncbi:hypothetical protein BRADI_5g07110v3 [Brachypodium distachyon]|uniref:RRM domain-containing protein n=1 Tax=Brachypodium distachyon TaxID=15368 RepID=I1IWV5_BRADI|nr:hypothetical protein BRADI_5g07110v3 [Brachypodium distachyon]
MEPTVRDVLAFHRVDRAAYERLLSLGAARDTARDAVALLMWLGRVVGADAVASVRPFLRTRADATRLVIDAHVVLRSHGGAPCLLPGAAAPVPLLDLVPAGADPRRGVADVLCGVGALVFDDRLHALLRRYEEDGGGELPPELAAPYRLSPLPLAVNERSLFVTFSKGYPLTREEIHGYFTERWGDGCVESVMIERTPPSGEAPTYGKVVFRSASEAAAVLGGHRLVKLLVNGRHLWARKYVPRQ